MIKPINCYNLFTFIILFIVPFKLLSAQEFVSGTVKDKDTHIGIPFAAILIKGTSYGALTDEHGDFNLKMINLTHTDTIQISAIGYENLILTKSGIKYQKDNEIFLAPLTYDLSEVKVKPKKTMFLGTYKYSTRNCSAFSGTAGNWKGNQAAIRANNKENVTVYFETFSFYIVKNLYPDSLKFRVMLYSIGNNDRPGITFLKKPILFKTNIKEGEVKVDLTPYDISTKGDFFISLECLEDSMDNAKFCFAGSIKVPSYFKSSAFSKWGKVKGGGGDFNVKVKYSK